MKSNGSSTPPPARYEVAPLAKKLSASTPVLPQKNGEPDNNDLITNELYQREEGEQQAHGKLVTLIMGLFYSGTGSKPGGGFSMIGCFWFTFLIVLGLHSGSVRLTSHYFQAFNVKCFR